VLVAVVAAFGPVDLRAVLEDWVGLEVVLVLELGAGDTIATVEVALADDGLALGVVEVDDVEDEPDED
jgi:hypothetical protein